MLRESNLMLHSALDLSVLSALITLDSCLGLGYDIPQAATKHRFYHPNRTQTSLAMIESALYHFQLSFTCRKAQYLRAGLMGRLIRKCYKFAVFKKWLALATDNQFDRNKARITSTDSG